MKNQKQKTNFYTIFVLAFALIISYPLSAYAVNTANCEIDNRFGAKEKAILERACESAVQRMQNAAIREKLYQKAKFHRITNLTLSRSNISDTEDIPGDLLKRQLLTLSLPNGENDTEPAFPDIYILYGSEAPKAGKTGWVGRAYNDLVTIYWDSSLREWRQKGKFALTINDYYVARGERNSDPNEWAGTIVHEMAHNLGHNHPNSSHSNYRSYQINILDRLVQTNGVESEFERESSSENHDCESESVTGTVTITINGRTVIVRE